MTHPLDVRIPDTLIVRIRRECPQYAGMPDIESVMAFLGQRWADRAPASAMTAEGIRSAARKYFVTQLQAVGCPMTEAYARAVVVFGRPE